MEIDDFVCRLEDLVSEYQNEKEICDSQKEISLWRKRFLISTVAYHKKFKDICEYFESTNSTAVISLGPEEVLKTILQSDNIDE